MRITLRLDNALLSQAKREAAKRGETLASVTESGLRLELAKAAPDQPVLPIDPPVSRSSPDGAA